MLIVSLSNGGHDNAAVIADDYTILAAVQRERITRIKGDGGYQKGGGVHAGMVSEALAIAGLSANDIEQVVITRGIFPSRYFYLKPWQTFRDSVRSALGNEKKYIAGVLHAKSKTLDMGEILRRGVFLQAHGFADTLPIIDSNHHYSHALSALFHTDWDDALIYTADGGGDNTYYSTYHYDGDTIHKLYGGDEEIISPSASTAHSVGLVYSSMTTALGYKKNRHEGKLTGLAALGEPTIYPQLKKHYSVRDDGLVESTFTSSKQVIEHVTRLGQSVAPRDAAASVQKFLEEIILQSLRCYLGRTGTSNIALAGGVFANVSLNRRIAELPKVKEVFIFPAMGDEGLAVGGVYDFLLRRDGLKVWQKQRHRLNNVYWGGAYDKQASALFSENAHKLSTGESPAVIAADLLTAGKIVAIYNGRMEFGPRALGARSILASPANAAVNQSLNNRLQRTEFMPFAPYVLEEDADEVFETTTVNRYAMYFMTITCKVREKWRKKIPAVVHVDGTARPQIINHQSNPLYAAVLGYFKQRTGLPVLVNTSFNAHEEPIVYKPDECLRALNDGRVDYVLLANGVYCKIR